MQIKTDVSFYCQTLNKNCSAYWNEMRLSIVWRKSLWESQYFISTVEKVSRRNNHWIFKLKSVEIDVLKTDFIFHFSQNDYFLIILSILLSRVHKVWANTHERILSKKVPNFILNSNNVNEKKKIRIIKKLTYQLPWKVVHKHSTSLQNRLHHHLHDHQQFHYVEKL